MKPDFHSHLLSIADDIFFLEKNISAEKFIFTFLAFQRKTVARENLSEARQFLF